MEDKEESLSYGIYEILLSENKKNNYTEYCHNKEFAC